MFKVRFVSCKLSVALQENVWLPIEVNRESFGAVRVVCGLEES